MKKVLAKTVTVVVVGVTLTTSVAAQNIASLVVPIENEPAVTLIVNAPLPEPLAKNVVYIPYRVENLRIMPVGGPASTSVSPRVGHLHLTLDDLPWQWADYGQSNTIILVNLPRGEHRLLVEAVDPEGRVLATQAVKFISPGK